MSRASAAIVEVSTGLIRPELPAAVDEATGTDEPDGSHLPSEASPKWATNGLLRVMVLFHESEQVGAGVSVLRVLDEVSEYGWSPSGWFPGQGPLVESASTILRSTACGERPIAVSRRGWREDPGPIERMRRTPAYLRAVRQALLEVQPHVVHVNTLRSLPEATVARSCGLPIVLQCHEFPEPSVKREAAVFLAARVADVLVGVSDAVCSMLRSRAFRTPVHLVRNGVPQVAPVATRSDEFIVGSVGTVSRVKGTDILMHAAAMTRGVRPDIRFQHVGSPDLHRDPGLDGEIAALLTDARIRDGGLEMLGALPAEDVLPNWSVFVSASRSEGFPLATLEAMAAGLPVVATTVGGVPEQIEHLVSGILVPPEDPEALSTWILRLRDDVELRGRLGLEARRRVGAEFTLKRQAEGLHRAYLTALTLRFGPSPLHPQLRGLK